MSLNVFCRPCLISVQKCLNVRFISFKSKRVIDKYVEKELPVYEFPHSSAADRRIYVCGLVATGALGIQLPKSSKYTSKKNKLEFIRYPMRLSFGEKFNITNIASGYGFTAFSVKSKDINKVFGTGLNTDSQLGYHAPRAGHPLEALMAPVPIYLPLTSHTDTKVIALSAGRSHLVIATDKEGVFTLGNNAFGQCGRRIVPSEDYHGSMIVHNIPHICNEIVIDVECGQDHSMFLTESGKVYACGWGSDGQTGLGRYENEWEPSLVKGDITSEKIVKLSCKADSVLALSDKGDVFGWGNTEYEQLPLGPDKAQQIHTSRYITNTKHLGKIVDIASGGCFCLIVNENGDVFTWGYGLLGKGPVLQNSAKPVQIPSTLFGKNEFNPNVRVVKVSCGLNHMAAISDIGDLFTWGRNAYGCLGLGHLDDQYFPLKVAIGAHVLEVSCGVDHMIVLARPFV